MEAGGYKILEGHAEWALKSRRIRLGYEEKHTHWVHVGVWRRPSRHLAQVWGIIAEGINKDQGTGIPHDRLIFPSIRQTQRSQACATTSEATTRQKRHLNGGYPQRPNVCGCRVPFLRGLYDLGRHPEWGSYKRAAPKA